MRRSAWRFWLAPAVFHVFLLPAFAQQPKLPDPNGTHIFRRILSDFECKPLGSPERLLDDSAGRVVIALGRWSIAQLPPSLIDFLKDGGSVLIASDFVASNRKFRSDFLQELGVAISRVPLNIPPESETAYLEGKGVFITSHGAAPFGDLKRVATIQPGFLNVSSERLQILAELPASARMRSERMRPKPQPFAAGTNSFGGKKGRVLILADHSVFTNALLWQKPGSNSANDNFEFARNCADWLTESGKRKEVLFYEDGNIVDDFDIHFMEDPTPPLPPIEDVVHAINQGLSGIEAEDRFTKGLFALAEQVDARTVIIATSILLAAYGLIRLGQAKYHAEPGRPLLETSLTQLVPSIDVAAQRQRWMLRHGNFAEAAQTLARQFFEYLQTTGLLQPHAGEPSADPPRLHSRQGLWETWKKRREVRRLWQVAYAELPKPTSARHLAALQAALKRLRQDFAQGTLQFQHSAGPPSHPPRPAQIV